MKIHRVVSEIWPWEFSLLHLKREICLRIPEYAGVVWSSVVLLRRKPENPWSSKQVSRVPLYASAPIAYDEPVYARVDAAKWVAWLYPDLGISRTVKSFLRWSLFHHVVTIMGHIHLRGKWRPRTPRWYNAALTHTKWMGNLSSPTLNSNCENRRACFCQTSPGMHVWGVLVPIGTVFMRSNRPRG